MIASRGAHRAQTAERGFTLIELVVVVAMSVLIAGSAYESLARRPGQTHATAVTFAGLVAQARSLASVTGDATLDGGSGASIGVVRDGDVYIATLYTYRPVLGAQHAPQIASNTPPFRTTTAIALGSGPSNGQPPFALFFSASGHASAQAGFTIGQTPALATEPVCSAVAGIVLLFGDTPHAAAHAISCEMARLDLDAPDVAAPGTATSQQ